MKRIIYTDSSGAAIVLEPAPNYIAELMADKITKNIVIVNDEQVEEITTVAGMTEAEAIQYIFNKDVPEACKADAKIIDAVTIPNDRTFRNAWVKDNATIKTDIPKAKLIAHDKRRAKRAAELAPLDIESTIPTKANQAEAARQAIRDKHATLQTAIDSATTEAALKQLLINAEAL